MGFNGLLRGKLSINKAPVPTSKVGLCVLKSATKKTSKLKPKIFTSEFQHYDFIFLWASEPRAQYHEYISAGDR
jgi:hypothetical protein